MSQNTQDMSLAVNIPPNAPPHVYAAAAAQFLDWGRADGALQVSELGLHRHPNYTGLKMFRAEALILHNRQELGEEDLRAVLAAEPQHPRAAKVLAQLLMAQHRYREAIPLLERAEFICVGDPDIGKWLAAAEQGAQSEPEPMAAPTAPPGFLAARETSERVRELTALPGVQAVSLCEGTTTRCYGEESERVGLRLNEMASLESDMAGILTEAGFGELVGVTLHDADALWASQRTPRAIGRVAAAGAVREGLLAWHLDRLLGEEPE